MVKVLFAALFSSGLTLDIPIASATGTQQSECVIGSSNACYAQSPQEIYKLYGTTTDGLYYINSNGTVRQVYLKMDQTGTSGGSWILMMKGAQGSANFYYGSNYFTTTGNAFGTIANNNTADAKYEVYDELPITRALAVLSNPQAGTLPSGGDIASNGFGGWTWMETITSQTMYTRLTTNQNIYGTSTPYTGGIRYSLWRNGSNDVFATQSGYGYYGFNRSTSCGGQTYRWGMYWNNEAGTTGSYDSCDASAAIGGTAYSASNLITCCSNPAYNQSGNAYGGGLGNMAFQLWGKVADPAVATPQSLVISNTTPGQLGLSWAAPAATTPTEYVVQYKTTATGNWSTANTFRVTTPGGSPSATITGLSGGTSYDVRIWARTSGDSSATPLTGSSTPYANSSTSLGLAGGVKTAIYRNAIVITATVPAAGKVKFLEKDKVIPNCRSQIAASTTATCSWKPTVRTSVSLHAVYTPNPGNGYAGSTSPKIFVHVLPRSNNR